MKSDNLGPVDVANVLAATRHGGLPIKRPAVVKVITGPETVATLTFLENGLTLISETKTPKGNRQ